MIYCRLKQRCSFYKPIESIARLTACVTRGWAGRDNADLTEPTPSHAKCLKTRRLPPVGCTLCWAVLSILQSCAFLISEILQQHNDRNHPCRRCSEILGQEVCPLLPQRHTTLPRLREHRARPFFVQPSRRMPIRGATIPHRLTV